MVTTPSFTSPISFVIRCVEDLYWSQVFITLSITGELHFSEFMISFAVISSYISH